MSLIELYSEDVREKKSEVGEEHGFGLQGKYTQEQSFIDFPHTLWNNLRHLETSNATVFSHLYHKQLLNTLLPLILHYHRQVPAFSV